MTLFNGKYRIESTRMKYWNYNWAASYFVTICTHNRDHFFGEIKDHEMITNPIGDMVNIEWLKTLELRPDMNLMLGDYQVMPNHFHGIVVIDPNKYNSRKTGYDGYDDPNGNDGEHDDVGNCTERRDAMLRVSPSTPDNPNDKTIIIDNAENYNPSNKKTAQNQFGPQKKNLGSILRGFKSAVTGFAHTIDPSFKWQPKFHDHVIRDQGQYDGISYYIRNNPKNWKEDRFY
ncbi:hypothetical protein G3O08_14195 [Cryomorpha ignava]|uniref:Transposase IS200-like domain-containing protein n=1 Tax=Cryomorpha ignava TaxID=101383 RepID=A0A7K3WT35_9FLAO|nr:transposase [Cryomorpha ignava]NEN24654.1 hypothetical protein [Cryomorpha ignava]